ncbi:MAG: helix-turn-helix domain-containing protein [Parabacteroides distasonis]
MLDSCLNDFPLDSLLSTGIRQLLEHDRRKSSEYFQTLDLFLQNEASITRTAEALFIHRSSLLKRLDKIYRILGSTLTQPDERLYLRICIQLLKKQSSRS